MTRHREFRKSAGTIKNKFLGAGMAGEREANRIPIFKDDYTDVLVAISRGVRVPKLELFKALKQSLLNEMQSENPKDYEKFFPGDVVGAVKFLVESAHKSNEEIRFAAARLDERIKALAGNSSAAL